MSINKYHISNQVKHLFGNTSNKYITDWNLLTLCHASIITSLLNFILNNHFFQY